MIGFIGVFFGVGITLNAVSAWNLTNRKPFVKFLGSFLVGVYTIQDRMDRSFLVGGVPGHQRWTAINEMFPIPGPATFRLDGTWIMLGFMGSRYPDLYWTSNRKNEDRMNLLQGVYPVCMLGADRITQ